MGFADLAEFILQQAQIDPPAALIVPGNPLQSNAIWRAPAPLGSRYSAMIWSCPRSS